MNYKDGRTLNKYYCKCGEEIHCTTALYGTGRCHKCGIKERQTPRGKNHINYKDGRSLKKYYCKKCSKEINWQTGTKGGGRCRKCGAKARASKTHWKYNEEIHKIHYCKEFDCNNQITYITWKKGSGICSKCAAKGRNKGITRSKKTRSLMSLARGGTGIPYENGEYPEEFNNELKAKIRKRDNYTCQNPDCGKKFNKRSRNLQVHHVDYDKQNNKETNLISLCNKCNMKANFNKTYWEELFIKIIRQKIFFINE